MTDKTDPKASSDEPVTVDGVPLEDLVQPVDFSGVATAGTPTRIFIGKPKRDEWVTVRQGEEWHLATYTIEDNDNMDREHYIVIPDLANGELCDEDNNYNGLPCAGDANGLYRNPTDAACFRQHPQAETPRPVFSAYKVLTTYVQDVEPYWQKRAGTPIFSDTCPGSEGPQEWIALYQPATKKRIIGMWARCEETEMAVIEATAPDGKAQLVAADGSLQELTAVSGSYTITLPRATHRNPFPGQEFNPTFPIGGQPYILIETDYRGDPPTPAATATYTPTPSKTPTATVQPTPTLPFKSYAPVSIKGPP